MNGIDLLQAAQSAAPELEMILVTGHGTIEVAVEALRLGAHDFIPKPVRKPALLWTVERATEKQHLARENRTLRSQIPTRGPRVVHNGSGMSGIMEMVAQVGPSSATVLITGECGTGKEVTAEAHPRGFAAADTDRESRLCCIARHAP
jgi:DNA-binding NtrC family response regulator